MSWIFTCKKDWNENKYIVSIQFYPYIICGRDSMYSLVGEKLNSYNCHIIKASLEFGT